MFRIANKEFEKNEELYNLATYCLTETIKNYLKVYFNRDYETFCAEELYKKVNWESVFKIFPSKLINEIKIFGIEPREFISKKIAQFMNLLNETEENTPDIFIEYIFYLMIQNERKSNFYIIPNNVSEKIPELKKMVRVYVKENDEFEDAKERNKYIKDRITFMTCFPSLLGEDDESLAFWDWDFSFFDEWGFEETIMSSAYGVLVNCGYGLDYTRAIFTDIGYAIPEKLTKYQFITGRND